GGGAERVGVLGQGERVGVELDEGIDGILVERPDSRDVVVGQTDGVESARLHLRLKLRDGLVVVLARLGVSRESAHQRDGCDEPGTFHGKPPSAARSKSHAMEQSGLSRRRPWPSRRPLETPGMGGRWKLAYPLWRMFMTSPSWTM